MDANTSNSPNKVSYTGGVRGKDGQIQRFDNPTDAYNSLYSDIHAKLNGKSSWVTPSITLENYISKFAPKEDNNDPVSYTQNMVKRFNSLLSEKGSNIKITKNDSLGYIKNALIAANIDPDHAFTKAHLQTEDPKVLKNLSI